MSHSYAQKITYSVCEIHTISSANSEYFLRTTPFDNVEQTPTGKTEVFRADSTKLYEIPRYFEIDHNRKELFISKDGKTVAYVIDKEFEWDNVQYKSIELFKNGQKFKEYALNDLIECKPQEEDCFLLYKDAIDSIDYSQRKRKIIFKSGASKLEKQLTRRAIYYSNDTITIFCKTGVVAKLDLASGNIKYNKLSSFDLSDISELDTLNYYTYTFKTPAFYGLPKLASGKSAEQGLAEYLKMKVSPEDFKRSDKFKSYTLNLEIIIDTAGNAYLDKIENYKNLPEEKVRSFIANTAFQATHIPDGLDQWRFSGWVTLMNASKREASRERKLEIAEEREAYNRRVVADSISGLYIPKNLDECFTELDKLLKKNDIEDIRSLKSREETIRYHHGLGTWLRNNWGLWGGSRLQRFLLNLGIDHPDSMSAYILENYHDWLNSDKKN